MLHEPYWNQSLLLLLGTYLSIVLGSALVYVIQRWRFSGAVLSGAEETRLRLTGKCRRISRILAMVTMILGTAICILPLIGDGHARRTEIFLGLALTAAGLAVWLPARSGALAKSICIWLVILTGTNGANGGPSARQFVFG